ncbi:MAG: efflux RND transporter permease subunit [Acidobacteria bacterium]|nr:efflux RND transporter permease subunit [Acidobacteriota bacterium]
MRSQALLDGQPAVTLIVSKQSGQNTVAVARTVKEQLKEIEKGLPNGFKMEIIGDNSIFIENSLKAIETHLIEGGALAAIVVFLFLWNFRSTLIAAIAIPTSIISTFALMYAMGYTLNQITMLSLTLMVGIVIDDAIVVLENIYRFVEEKGMSPFQAAIEGTREIGLAVLATTLSLMAVFVPIGFMAGIVGRFMSSFGLTSAFAIAVSLLVSFTLTPMLAARLIKPRKEDEETPLVDEVRGEAHHEHHKTSKESWFYSHIDGAYVKMLEFSMSHRWLIVVMCLLVIISTVPLFMFVGKNFLPVDDQSQFEVSIRVPEGSSLQSSTVLMERIASDIRKMEGVTHTLVTVGGGQQQVVNAGTIYVKLSDLGSRPKSQEIMMSDTRDLMKNYPPELRTAVQQVAAFSGGGFRNANVQYFIGGPDLKISTTFQVNWLSGSNRFRTRSTSIRR